MSSTLDAKFRSIVAETQRAALLDSLRQSPGTTLGELSKLPDDLRKVVEGITVGELMGGVSTARTSTPSKVSAIGSVGPVVRRSSGSASAASGTSAAADAGRRSTSAVAASEVSTRTPAEREVYDLSILSALKASSSPMSAQDLRQIVGGTPLQARTALNRLIADGRVSWEGKARATLYTAAG